MNTSENLTGIYNFLQLSDSIATAGQPTADQFALLKQAGYEVVINLALPTSTNAIPNEAEIVAAQAMDYISIPVVWENPTLADAERFFQAMQTHTNRKVFVHCAMNMRVSAFMYLYRRIYEQIDEATAKQDLNKIWTPNSTWQQFIDQVLQQHQ
ncbi:MAG: protein tyrosine phosphatase family protein [Leptolyngbya sp. IPPAS B-1204]|nr:protein tyrosine phosphatase family protein [Elainella sp. C42_A2020_010]RNJ66580.1 MAG: phosphatase [Leptolyngbya sp. IPPAS B-1204]